MYTYVRYLHIYGRFDERVLTNIDYNASNNWIELEKQHVIYSLFSSFLLENVANETRSTGAEP